MTNFEKFIDFLERNEGKRMNIGFHLPIAAVYNTVDNWTIREQAVSTSIVADNQEYEFYHEDLNDINEDPESMGVFLSGNEGFEIRTISGSAIGFELEE